MRGGPARSSEFTHLARPKRDGCCRDAVPRFGAPAIGAQRRSAALRSRRPRSSRRPGSVRRTASFTFAIVAHDEAETLAGALDQCRLASGPGDEVWFVDSASSDGSAQIAASAGVERVAAPLGKGRAVAEAYARCATDYLCLLDGDLHASGANIAEALADAVALRPVDMVVGQFWDPEPTILSGTLGLYTPLMQTFFPECEDRFGSRPLSGFRALRTGLDLGAVPPGYGLEAHLNCQMLIAGAETAIGDIGWYQGAYRRKTSMAIEIADGVLDQAERCSRLPASERTAWDEWVDTVAGELARYEGDPADAAAARRRMHALLACPRP